MFQKIPSSKMFLQFFTQFWNTECSQRLPVLWRSQLPGCWCLLFPLQMCAENATQMTKMRVSILLYPGPLHTISVPQTLCQPYFFMTFSYFICILQEERWAEVKKIGIINNEVVEMPKIFSFCPDKNQVSREKPQSKPQTSRFVEKWGCKQSLIYLRELK